MVFLLYRGRFGLGFGGREIVWVLSLVYSGLGVLVGDGGFLWDVSN